jgi:undecaprenyl-diphosphatase
MSLLRAAVLGVVQGATEFLPISSSGHLVLVPWLLGWPEPGLLFDTLVHWGTLLAVLAYYRKDFLTLLGAWLSSVRERRLDGDPQRRLAWLLLIGSVPAGLAGLLLQDFFENLFGQPPAAATLLLITGLLLAASEYWRHKQHSGAPRHAESRTPLASAARLSIGAALFVGLAQALAIAPGISRSGATIAAGLLVGLSRPEAARFSFLLATPAILGAGLLQLADLAGGNVSAPWISVVAGFLAAAVVGYLAIRFLLDYLQRHALYIFAVYCWLAGAVGLIVYWAR